MQADHRLDAAFDQSFEHLPITPDCLRIKMALFRFNARPADCQSHRIDADRFGDVEILFGRFPPVAGFSTTIPGDDAAPLLEFIPFGVKLSPSFW